MPKTKSVIRYTDSLGRVTIPSDIRNKLDISYYDIIEFHVNQDKLILTRKYYKMCHNCKYDLVQHTDLFCPKCGNKLYNPK